MGEFDRWLIARTELIITARRMKQKGLVIMPMELKGLKGKAMQAGSMFDRLNKAYDNLIETGDAHAADVESLPAQIEGLQDDLTFMVQTLGNSVGGSGASPVKPIVPPVVSIEPPAPTAQAPIVSQQAPIQPTATFVQTFRAEAEQQIAAGHK